MCKKRQLLWQVDSSSSRSSEGAGVGELERRVNGTWQQMQHEKKQFVARAKNALQFEIMLNVSAIDLQSAEGTGVRRACYWAWLGKT